MWFLGKVWKYKIEKMTHMRQIQVQHRILWL